MLASHWIAEILYLQKDFSGINFIITIISITRYTTYAGVVLQITFLAYYSFIEKYSKTLALLSAQLVLGRLTFADCQPPRHVSSCLGKCAQMVAQKRYFAILQTKVTQNHTASLPQLSYLIIFLILYLFNIAILFKRS